MVSQKSYKKIIFHIPHSSIKIPKEYRSHISLSDKNLAEEIRLMTDWYTDELFDKAVSNYGIAVKFPISRLVVDPERFADDEHECMSKVGMGVLYTKTSHGELLRDPKYTQGKVRSEILDRYYFPHHNELTSAVCDELDKNNLVLIIDCHSFPEKALPYELDQKQSRPDICIGTDPYHTPHELGEGLKNSFENLGYQTHLNNPFSGSIVPNVHYHKNKKVHSVMIEVNRSLYMHNETTERNKRFQKIKCDIHAALNIIFSK